VRFAVLAIALAAAACGGKSEEPVPTRSAEEQRAADSAVGASNLPGARGVQGAMAAADSAAARKRVADSLAQQP
jgi:hypothetical protein